MVAMNGNVAVRCENVDKFYGNKAGVRVQALHGCSLDVMAGEMLMLVGPSGCGKTTLLSVIVGILNVDAGAIRVFETDVTKLSGNRKAKFRGKNVGFAFQSFNLIPALTAVENASIPLLIAGESRGTARKKAAAILEQMGMGDRLDSLPVQLSGGQQQRVAFARALVHEPRLIVCDEPTSALDSRTGDKVLAVLKEVAVKEGRAVIVVTHDSRIFHHADRIAQMEDGHITKITRSGDEGHPRAILQV
jgi:putative ABC transport system ATP-binding protein